MRYSTLLAAAGLAGVTVADLASTNATVVNDNLIGVKYTATLAGNGVDGSVTAVAHPDGTGVDFTVTFEHLPYSGGPFMYHIHQTAVPANGNCTATGGHLDPFGRGDKTACDASQPQTCQVGDLSGKYGMAMVSNSSSATVFQATYTDLYASTNPAHESFFGNRSIVVHAQNLTRLACGNFVQTSGLSNKTSPTSSSSPSPTSSPVLGGAAAFGGEGAGRVAGLVVALAVGLVAVL